MKRVAVLQSNYIPWKGYFDIMASVDEFIVYDEVQYTKNDWRNRNIIRTPSGPLWLTIPVRHTGRFGQAIDETLVSDHVWPKKHWQSLVTYYSKTPFFEAVGPVLKETYDFCRHIEFLSQVNLEFIQLVAGWLGITTRITSSRGYPGQGGRNERLLNLCLLAGATHYLSGPAARGYLDEDLFKRSGITVSWMDYSDYPDYPQLYPLPFSHNVSVLDLILCVGTTNAPRYMRTMSW